MLIKSDYIGVVLLVGIKFCLVWWKVKICDWREYCKQDLYKVLVEEDWSEVYQFQDVDQVVSCMEWIILSYLEKWMLMRNVIMLLCDLMWMMLFVKFLFR